MHGVGLGDFFFPLPVFPLLTHFTSMSFVSRGGRRRRREPRPVLRKSSEAGGPGGSLRSGTQGKARSQPRLSPVAPRWCHQDTPGAARAPSQCQTGRAPGSLRNLRSASSQEAKIRPKSCYYLQLPALSSGGVPPGGFVTPFSLFLLFQPV